MEDKMEGEEGEKENAKRRKVDSHLAESERKAESRKERGSKNKKKKIKLEAK